MEFGLGAETAMKTVEISWPSGKKESLQDVPADFIYTIIEGGGIQQKTPFAKDSSTGTATTAAGAR
jgi:hypothetical protein